MKIHRKALFTTVVMLAGAVASTAAQGGVEVDKNVALPVTIEKTWYRTGKVRLFGKAYEQTGTLTVSDTGVEFTFDKGTVNIPKSSITWVEWGKLSPDIQNDWAVVHYTDTTGAAIVAFKGALFAGSDKDNLIFSALMKLMVPKDADSDVPSEPGIRE